jgi:hypothetical protein
MITGVGDIFKSPEIVSIYIECDGFGTKDEVSRN